MRRDVRYGIDLGGTKIAGVALAPDDTEIARHRVPTPRDDYEATLAAIAAMLAHLEAGADGALGSVGLGIPGSLAPTDGRVQNANSTWLNGRHLQRDLEERLSRPVAIANDADCFALSEAHDGAAKGAGSAFGVIIGTGCGGGIVIGGRLLSGPRGSAGEWGHTPLPWVLEDEFPGPACWCGQRGCMETWVSGPGLAADHYRATGEHCEARAIAQAARGGNRLAIAALDRHTFRLARGLAMIVNILDPEVIVLGGGLSEMAHLYEELPRRMAPFVFARETRVRVVPARWGAASGVRGAARLPPLGGSR
ncbi:MAG: ROK family protein [Rhizobiales bacterium]|nr:ROK family protein [Hyphomicrobiales bacterium]